jgi:divalent metal cation (Fe/Co/Zn/Cd) transporter
MILGYSDEILTLFGFGVDSSIEVISGMGIAVMITRIQQNPKNPTSRFETRALKITGTSFYLLSAGLALAMVIRFITRQTPETTFWGIIISLISIVVMFGLMRSKRKVGNSLHSEAILADANCTLVCIYMSLVLLGASLIYEITGFPYADLIGSAGLIYFSLSEGKEAFEKARGKKCCNC